MMKVFRFMSRNEFDKFMNGETLSNKTDFSKNRFSTSKGFCFFQYLDWNSDDLNGMSPDYAYMFASGVVSDEVVAVFETNLPLTHSSGRYADPYGSFDDTMWIDEYCTEEYSNKTFRLIKAGHMEEVKGQWEENAVWDLYEEEENERTVCAM